MDRERLASAARNRRLTLDLDIEDVARRSGLHRNTITKVEHGQPVKVRTLWKLDRGLGWVRGSAERVLAGGDPDNAAEPEDRMTRSDALGALREVLASQGRDVAEVDQMIRAADQLPDAELFKLTAEVLLDAYRNRPDSENRELP
jgi:transcriptional regulator with XRE-family HTH domain